MSLFELSISQAWPPDKWQDVAVIVAVSGGPDSVALLTALARLQEDGVGQLVAAHFNHRLRGAAADADAQFVAELSRRLGIECELGEADVFAKDKSGGDGLEADARQARYDFLTATARKRSSRYVATGHTADDQAETILHHILRGTGLTGLSGMPRSRKLCDGVTLIRPLLTIRRREVLAYLDEIGQPFCEDATNKELYFTRNRIRNDLLPQLASDYNPNVVEALLRLGALAGEAQEVIDALVKQRIDTCLRPTENGAVIDCQSLAAESEYFVREVLIQIWRDQSWPFQEMGYSEWEELANMTRIPSASEGAKKTRSVSKGTQETRRVSKGTRKTFPGRIMAEKKGEQLLLTRPD